MSEKQIWLVTGAGRGMGTDIAKAALAAGHAVVATGRNPGRVTAAVGDHGDLLVVPLDVTDTASVQAAIDATVARFGRIDVVVNNAGNFKAGFFEEIPLADFRAQVETVLFGSVNVVRAVLPVMRAQQAGLVVQISSTAGIAGGEFLSAYAAAKFGVEGWFESLTPEVAPFDIRTLLIEPGFFRTDLLTPESTDFAESVIEDYAQRTKDTVTQWQSMNGKQGGDPAKLANALVQLVGRDKTPLRWPAGADANRDLSSHLSHDDGNRHQCLEPRPRRHGLRHRNRRGRRVRDPGPVRRGRREPARHLQCVRRWSVGGTDRPLVRQSAD